MLYQKYNDIIYKTLKIFRKERKKQGGINLIKKAAAVSTAIFCILATFTGCSMPDLSFFGSSSDDDGSGANLNISIESNPENLDPQTASDEESKNIICNIMEGLMTFDENGELENGTAESYEISSDSLTYTFKIRDDAMWFFDKNDNDYMDDDEYTPVTAQDFVFAFQRIFNPDTESPYRETFSFIKNGNDIINGSKNYTDIGVTATDDKTVVFQLDKAEPYFLTLLASTAAMPCSQEFFESTKGRYGLDDKSINSNGPFYIQQWFYDPYGNNNFMYIRRNSDYKKGETVYPRLITVNIKKSESDLEDDFSQDKSDVLITDNYKLRYISSRSYNAVAYDYATLGLIFNPKDKSLSNKNLRKALRYAIDQNSLSDGNNIDKVASGIVPPSVSVLGRSYRELYSEDNLSIKQDTEKAKELFNKALKESSLQTFDSVKILVCTNSINSNYLHNIIQQWQDILGYFVSVDEVGKNEFDKRIADSNYQIALYELNSDFNSPESFLSQFTIKDNIFAVNSDEINNAYKKVIETASLSDRINLYGDVESKIISADCFYPLFYKPVYVISPSKIQDFLYDPFGKQVYWKYIKKFS